MPHFYAIIYHMKKFFYGTLFFIMLSCSGCDTTQPAAQSELRFPETRSEAEIEKAQWQESQDRFENDFLEINN
ncbi:MAG: hypothetical protein Q8Q33_07970 [Chlamydiota bacterium]|nr:hypothetical protein [Chlamydiota bacterium]